MHNEKPRKKILVLGDYGVGKTSLIKQCINEEFDDQHLTTLGVNIALKEISMRFGGEKADIDVELELWDIAGNKGIADVKREFYKDSDGSFLIDRLTTEGNEAGVWPLNYYLETFKIVQDGVESLGIRDYDINNYQRLQLE